MCFIDPWSLHYYLTLLPRSASILLKNMLPKKETVNFVEIDSSSDDEQTVGVAASAGKASVRAPEGPAAGSNPRLDNQTMQSRSFWKAGDYAVASTTNSTSTQGALFFFFFFS